MTDKLLDHILNQNNMLLDRALAGDGGQLAQLQTDLDTARRQHEHDAAKITELERGTSILSNALDEASGQAETLQQQLRKTDDAHHEMRNILHQRDETIQQLTKQVEQLENRPMLNPEWEDLDRFITAAVGYFNSGDPDKAFKHLTRAHLALQGKELNND